MNIGLWIIPSIITVLALLVGIAYAIRTRREWSRGEGFGKIFLFAEAVVVALVIVCICGLVWLLYFGWLYFFT